MTDKRSRDWCFTINNYQEADISSLLEIATTTVYLVFGKEVGSSGTPHIQGYLYFKDAKTFSRLKKLMPTAHIEPRCDKSTPLQAATYCKKDGDFQEFGTLPQPQGKRNDLQVVRDMINNGSRMIDVLEVATSYQSVKMAELMLKYKEKKRNWKPYVEWYWGSTGTGKSRAAFSKFGDDCYVAMDSAKWWEGYDAHENVIIDDMRDSFMPFQAFLRLLDRNAYRVEVKGASRQFLARHIIITSPHHPKDMYRAEMEDIEQLLRRIDVIVEFTNKPCEPKHKPKCSTIFNPISA